MLMPTVIKENQVDINYRFYKKNLESFKKTHLNKWLLIAEEKLQGAFDGQQEAYNKWVKSFGLGNFIVHQCLEKEEISVFFSKVR